MADPAGPRPGPSAGVDLEELRAAWRELNEVVEEIRRLPGHRDFMAAPTFDDVAAAAEHPLCYIAAADAEGLALIVRATADGDADVEHVPLPGLTAAAVHDRVGSLLASYGEFRARGAGGHAAWAADLDAVTRWAWEAAMGDVLRHLPGAPAVTLVPGGLLGLLPLHAAWTEDARAPTGRRYALDATTIGYAPNARSLTAARAIAAERTGRALLAVTEPRPLPARYPRMPFTALEAAVARHALPDAPRTLDGEAATLAAVQRGIAGADVVHLACHGFADLDRPLDSGLVLAGGEILRVRDLMAMNLRLRLAFLSACETSLPGTELPDEVVSLPTGLLQAGAAGVVASLWAVPDMVTAMVAAEFYRRWRRDGHPPARALRDAQIWVRDTTNGEKAAVWERALDGDSGWPPGEVADALLDHVLEREPDDRDEASIPAWAGFGHVGV
ncbi:CHAT domain-containing protein [Actinomadura formosensis]|uniref:CHAT domain-containing protein n=1 Tax=Actinomadura formosensis TaxID=60706 RepID=UPI000833C104|nr:CHAT domain-containing protein [Actinomadura formosensis]